MAVDADEMDDIASYCDMVGDREGYARWTEWARDRRRVDLTERVPVLPPYRPLTWRLGDVMSLAL